MANYIKQIMTNEGAKQIDYTALANLPTIDAVVTDNSTNAVQSGAVYDALQGKLGTTATAANSSKLGGVAAADYAKKADLTALETKLGGSDTTINTAITNLQTEVSKKAPTNHASTADTYGTATASNYGHVKLSDSIKSTSGVSSGIAATPKAVNDVGTSSKTYTDDALKVHNIQTYSTFEQLGFTNLRGSNGYLTSCPTVQETYNKMVNGSILIMIVNADNNNLSQFWNLPASKGFIEMRRVDNKRGQLTFYNSESGRDYISSITGGIPDCIAWNKMLTAADFLFDSESKTLSVTL